jgi:hypothetical protein
MDKTFISNIIVNNRLDLIQILQELYPIDWNKKCCTIQGASITPLEFALIHKQYQVAKFLMDNGAKM